MNCRGQSPLLVRDGGVYDGDNLQVLRDRIAIESVDPIYLDPPFDSNATYNVGVLGEGGRDRTRSRTAAYSREAKFTAFLDSMIRDCE